MIIHLLMIALRIAFIFITILGDIALLIIGFIGALLRVILYGLS